MSSAFTTTSSPCQKSSSNTSSVSGETRFCSGSTLSAPLIALAALVAQVLFAWPMFQSRKRNCLERLDFSMTSSSVTVTLPSAPQDRPMSAKFLMNSQPSAPAPTRKIF